MLLLYFAFGNISLFNISLSIDILPGPDISKLIEMDISKSSNSYPPTNPFEIFAAKIAPIISIMNNIEAILVTIPTINANPPITSKRAMGKANSGGRPIEPKNPEVLSIPDSFGRPCNMKAIPAIILKGKGENVIHLSILEVLSIFNILFYIEKFK